MTGKILKITILAGPLLAASQAFAHPDIVPHIHPHGHEDQTALMGLAGLAALGCAVFLLGKTDLRKKVKK